MRLANKKSTAATGGGGSLSVIVSVCCCFISFFLGRLSSGTPDPFEASSLQEQLAKLQQQLEGCTGTGTSSSTSDASSYHPPKIPPARAKDMTTLTTVDIRGLELCHKTVSRGWEVVFDSFIGTIFREPGFLPDQGGILDVGAQFAEQSCHYGSIHPHRTVFTIDPSPSNQKFANETYSALMPNMRLIQGGLGTTIGSMKATGGFFNMRPGTVVPIYTIDSIFVDKKEKLAFAHIDVEGMELHVLRGGVKTIQQDRPVFTTEVRVHRNASYTRELLDFIDKLGYDSYVVNEVCGAPFMDYRNVLNIPREISGRLVHSDVFSLALATDTIFRATSNTIFELVYPCCAPGGACCPDPTTVTKPRFGCCSEAAVNKYLRDNPPKMPPAAYVDWNNAKKVTEQRWKELEQRATRR